MTLLMRILWSRVFQFDATYKIINILTSNKHQMEHRDISLIGKDNTMISLIVSVLNRMHETVVDYIISDESDFRLVRRRILVTMNEIKVSSLVK